MDEQAQNQDEGKFRKALAQFLNEWCGDSATDTPDYILADYLCDCLEAYGKAKRNVEKWMAGTEPASIPRRIK